MNTFRFIVALAITGVGNLVLADGSTNAGDEPALAAEVQRCGELDDSEQRLACFDTLAAGLVNPPTAPIPADAAVVSNGAAPLTDDVARSAVAKTAEDDSERYAGKLTACEFNSRTRRTYFYFDNGQIWGQSNSGRLNLDDCDFEVVIEKDGFGYKLLIPSEKRRIRVKRLK
ncbi:MAG TPA: hypothetical protein PKK10_11745 [Woeseiaceae bacterium]|nr:hypothetical protein [Woeseiaceae bacterium]